MGSVHGRRRRDARNRTGPHRPATAAKWLSYAGTGRAAHAGDRSTPYPDHAPKSWGVTLALYGLRTAQEGGFGSYMDLAQAVEGLGQAGADFVGINPIHAGFPTDPKAFSPYSPSSRQRLSIAHIAVPGVSGSQSDLIDYMADRPAQMAALRAAFAALDPQTRAGLDSTAARDPSLHLFAVHQAIADRHGPLWPEWPTELQDPASEHVAMFAQEHAEAVAFHVWAQNMAAQQLDAVREAAAGAEMRFGLYLDLAVGTHPGGAETWAQPDAFARGVSLGAPPDAFSPGGQSWGIAPFNPRALIAQGFAPFIETLRAQFRYAKLLRIDHVLGFDRAFWVPEGDAPGAYVTMPKAALLAIARVEAARAGGWVVGEDLGNVPDGLREDMEDAGILGCRVAMFERNGTPPVYSAPATYDPLTLASFASHDLPTWKGWRAGRDLEWWAQIGHLPEDQLPIAKAERAAEVAAFDAIYGTTDGSADSLHRALALSSATLVAIQAEDMLGVTEQPNLPGTIDAHPNWRRRLPVSAAALGQNPDVLRTCALMRRDSP
ncbi:4-alpha-glucanotransferase (plasmid) [Rhodobacteraceae bacterium SC52]|nr:4-alpha-glucanotransferase [Rhodobacteraceae bacterium SC52]